MKDMEQLNEHITGTRSHGLLHNTGGPRSRTRTENVQRSAVNAPGMAAASENHFLQLPEWVTNPESWLLQMAREEGIDGWEEAERLFILPRNKMTVTQPEGPVEPAQGNLWILRTAMILARTNGQRYLPEGPAVFTRHRLDRCLRLVEIDLNGYYGMD